MSGVQARDVWKAFGGTIALRGASLTVQSGSIHALVGENGAGKSTLIKAITGVHRADRGELLIGGRERHFASPQDAIDAGISAVYQERNLVPEFSVAENLFLHAPPRTRGFLRYRQMYRDAQGWLDRVGLRVDPRVPASRLSVAQGQLVEIARALALEDTVPEQARVLLLDEPTASITEREAQVLFDILRELRDQGSAILFVSHKLDEVFSLCDRITVLRDGETILDGVERSSVTQTDVITAMVGRSVVFAERRPAPAPRNEPPLLELDGVTTNLGHDDVSLAVPAGRVVGLYGLVGAGRSELAKAIMGIGRIEGGRILLRGEPVRIRNPHEALQKHRIGYVSEDRKGEGLILSHPISRNVGITVWDRLKGPLGFITPGRERRRIEPVMDKIQVKLSSLDQPVGQLSGGNQQKVSVAKWLASDSDVLIIDEPTIGVDVRTKEEMYVLIEQLASDGLGVLLISSDLSEIVRLSDSILVMADNRIVAAMPNSGDYDVLSHSIMDAIISAQPRRLSELQEA
ncbi:MAG: ribose transport system ATP-binding protein [Solirubrobacteraceae bacterium]|nr:ribose transport system ATP-binding protein [Solirubrobacteraceae bacterium]